MSRTLVASTTLLRGSVPAMQSISDDRSGTAMRRLGMTTLTILLVAAFGITSAAAAKGAAPDTTVWGWGANDDGQLGTGVISQDSDVPVAASALSGVTAVSAGGGGSNGGLALLSDGTVMAWGCDPLECTDTPTAISGLSGVKAISAGGTFSLFLLRDGKVMAWGNDGWGQLGNGTIGGTSSALVMVSGLSGVTAISAGNQFGLALLHNGRVMAWGANDVGQLGSGTSGVGDSSDVPVPVSGLRRVQAISAGDDSSVALLDNRTVMAWGINDTGELGNGTTGGSSDVPVAVRGLNGVTAISFGSNHCLALLGNDTVMAWGHNTYGQLGDGTVTDSDLPVAVSAVTGVTAISAGGVFSLARLSNGTVASWGADYSGQLGNGTVGGSSEVPVAVSGLSGVTAISAGNDFSFALT
jgi:alpha-tubulin suppressor-like RCC1 family protein